MCVSNLELVFFLCILLKNTSNSLDQINIETDDQTMCGNIHCVLFDIIFVFFFIEFFPLLIFSFSFEVKQKLGVRVNSCYFPFSTFCCFFLIDTWAIEMFSEFNQIEIQYRAKIQLIQFQYIIMKETHCNDSFLCFSSFILLKKNGTYKDCNVRYLQYEWVCSKIVIIQSIILLINTKLDELIIQRCMRALAW